MAGISEKSSVIEAPVGVVLHVFQLPYSEAIRVCEQEEAFCNRIEVFVDAKNGVERDFLVVCCKENASISEKLESEL